MRNHDRSHARAPVLSRLSFHLDSGRRRTKWAFRSRDRVERAAEQPRREQNDQRRNRNSRSPGVDDALSRLELAAFALYVEAAAVVRQPGELEGFTQRVIERFARTLETEQAPPVAESSRF